MSALLPKTDIAIVGAGHAGGRVAQHLRTLGHRGRIALIGDESHAPYERPALSKELLTGEVAASHLTLAPDTFWADTAALCIDRHHAKVTHLMVEEKTLLLGDTEGSVLPFDTLVVATGGKARRPPIDNSDIAGVHTLRTIDDCLALREVLVENASITIIGAGVIGMEVAAAARKLNVRVTVLEAQPAIMGRLLPDALSAWLASVHRENGVTLITDVAVRRIERDDASALRVLYGDDGQYVASDIVLIAAGIECATGFLEGTGIGGAHGVTVDAFCRSPVAPWCYAVGDVAATFNTHYDRVMRQETWRNAENQARAAAEFILGRTTPYVELPWMWSDQFGHNLQVVGQPCGGDTTVLRGVPGAGPATFVSLSQGAVTGAVMIDQGRDRRWLERMISERTQIDIECLSDMTIPLKHFAS
jgi:3-phenylpropionate/trans-cinnamate dioxygenase ferredoxin reductase subunit